MKMILFGTGPFAVPTFRWLIESEHHVMALVTRPIEQPGKRRKVAPNPSRDLAEEHNLEVLQPLDANATDFARQLNDYQSDLFVVCDFGQILSKKILSASRLGGINLHGSLLPKYRGAAPINWAIYHGDSQTGVTVIHMTSRLDGGPMLAHASLPIGTRDTAATLEPQLAELGIQPVRRSIEMLEDWDGSSPLGQIQDTALACSAPRLSKSDGRIQWARSALQIHNQIRAFQPWPGSFSFFSDNRSTDPSPKTPLRVIIHQTSLINPPAETEIQGVANLRPGQIRPDFPGRMIVQTGEGLLSVDELQPAGKRAMSASDFLRGYTLNDGQFEFQN